MEGAGGGASTVLRPNLRRLAEAVRCWTSDLGESARSESGAIRGSSTGGSGALTGFAGAIAITLAGAIGFDSMRRYMTGVLALGGAFIGTEMAWSVSTLGRVTGLAGLTGAASIDVDGSGVDGTGATGTDLTGAVVAGVSVTGAGTADLAGAVATSVD